MNYSTKDQQSCEVICKKNHTARSDRDLSRVCPSKLSKRELENLYFALLDNNLELKKTLHSQRDKLKVLSTKVQRMTVVQRNAAGKEKDCCNSKVLVNEQKEEIADLKGANEQMSEKIRLLNMRLCSAKQFLRSPLQKMKCPKCGICPVPLNTANSSSAALIAKPSLGSIRMTSVSSQYISNEVHKSESPEPPKPMPTVPSETDEAENEATERQCNENKCRTTVDELKQKIVNLEKELSKSHDEYSIRISKLESDVSSLHHENTMVKTSKAASEHAMQIKEKKAEDLQGKLRQTEGKVNDLTMQLTVERRRVKELETALRLAHKPSQVSIIIEKLNDPQEPNVNKNETLSPTGKNSKKGLKVATLDDSGCSDLNNSCDAEELRVQTQLMERVNQEMIKKMSELQMQLDGLRIKAAGELVQTDGQKSPDFYNNAGDDVQMDVTMVTKDQPNVILEIKELGVKENVSKPERDVDTSTLRSIECNTSTSKEDPIANKTTRELVPRKISNNDEDIGVMHMPNSAIVTRPPVDQQNVEIKLDNNNRNQIPGPLPTPYQITQDTKKTFKNSNRLSKDKDKNLRDGKCVKINADNEVIYNDKDKTDDAQIAVKPSGVKAKTDGSPIKKVDPAKVLSQNIKIIDPKEANNAPAISKDKDENRINEDNVYAKSRSCRDSLAVARERLTKDKTELAENVKMAEEKKRESSTDVAEINKEATSNYFYPSDTAATLPLASPLVVSQQPGNLMEDKNMCLNETPEEYALPMASPPQLTQSPAALIQLVQQAPRRDSATATDKPHTCDSATYTEMPPTARRDLGTCTAMEQPNRRDSATYTAMPPGRRDSATYTAMAPSGLRNSATYTAPGSNDNDKCKFQNLRLTQESPASTEREISSLSDLPPEKDGKSYRRRAGSSIHSIGSRSSRKQNTTSTDTDTHTGEYGTLSDGEIPQPALIRTRKLSFGEQPGHDVRMIPPVGSEAQMEATLEAIGEELANCRKLLATARDRQCSSVGSGVLSVSGATGPFDSTERVHHLRAAANSRHLSDTAAPTAAFTLHIGTLVLSDEAVLNSRNKTLCLAWQFYDQAVATTRMRAGRVVLFHFSTEYDVSFTDHFLNYMKHEDMPITICDVNKQNEQLATCFLPLKDALIHTNRRADMSLALGAGPGWKTVAGGASADLLVAGDELGVLDLWCSLRVPPRLRTAINTSIARNPTADPNREETLNLAHGSGSRVDNQSNDDDQENRISQEFLIEPSSLQGSRTCRYDSNMSTAPLVASSRDWSVDRPASQRDSRAFMEDQIPKGLQDMFDTERKMSTAAKASAKQTKTRKARVPFSQNSRDEDTDPALTRKYNNIGKFIGLNKFMEASKKTVTYTDVKPPRNLRVEETSTKQDSIEDNQQSIDITVLWLALNEECEAMLNPRVQRLYVAYSFLGRCGAELETPISLSKPKHYADKCYFNFKKTFNLHDADLPLLGHMSRCRAGRSAGDPRDCLVFSVVSEPPEDPLGLLSCEDIGRAYLYLGDILAYSAGGAGYTEVVPVRAAATAGSPPGAVCGVLCVRVDGLQVLRRCLSLSHSSRDLPKVPP